GIPDRLVRQCEVEPHRALLLVRHRRQRGDEEVPGAPVVGEQERRVALVERRDPGFEHVEGAVGGVLLDRGGAVAPVPGRPAGAVVVQDDEDLGGEGEYDEQREQAGEVEGPTGTSALGRTPSRVRPAAGRGGDDLTYGRGHRSMLRTCRAVRRWWRSSHSSSG